MMVHMILYLLPNPTLSRPERPIRRQNARLVGRLDFKLLWTVENIPWPKETPALSCSTHNFSTATRPAHLNKFSSQSFSKDDLCCEKRCRRVTGMRKQNVKR